MLVRIVVVLTCCALFLGAGFLLDRNQPPAIKIAAGMGGESWYRIELNAEHVGFMYNHAFQDRTGAWHFKTTTHFLLQENSPNTISKHLVFGANAPYPLKQAIYANRQQQRVLATEVALTPDGYVARLQRRGQTSEVAIDWQFDLATFVSFEHWLATTAPSALAEQVVKSPDFERLQITQRTFAVVEQNEQGYLVQTNAPFAATQTQLDSNYRPIQLNMAGIFDVIASNEADAISLKQLRAKTNYLFTVDQRLDNHTALARLHLRLDGSAQFDLPNEFHLTANPVTSSGDGSNHAGEELRYPITHPSIQALVQSSLANSANSQTTIDQLVDTTNQQLRYVEDDPAGSVLAALAAGRGECTDYADLFTTLARAAGFPARNVYGLAYKDGSKPAFMFHAWNEVYHNDQWQAVDPTWNQTQVDATHIPLSDAQAAIMMLANNTSRIGFSVLDTEYF